MVASIGSLMSLTGLFFFFLIVYASFSEDPTAEEINQELIQDDLDQQ